MSAAQPSIVFLDAATYGDISLQRFTDRWNCTIYPTTNHAETVERIAGHAVAITNKVAFNKTIFDAAEARDLKLVVVAATGTDIIDKQAALNRGVKVCNVPGYATQSVAQFTMALILELATRVGRYVQAVQSGEWQRSAIFSLLHFPHRELAGKKLGIIGYGNIGQAVSQMARGFGLDILISARPASKAPISQDRVPFEELLQQADIVSLHCPLAPATKHLINGQTLALMKPTAFLINTARGGLVDETALIHALRNRQISAAALDVISQEPPPADLPIVRAAAELNNLLVTPHTAWSAREARERLIEAVEQNIEAYQRGEPKNLVG